MSRWVGFSPLRHATLGANTFTGSQTLADGTVLKWSDVGISRLGGGILGFGNGAAGNASAEIRAGVGAFTGAVSLGNTVNSVSPTSPNRTITFVVGGATLYVHAKTTND